MPRNTKHEKREDEEPDIDGGGEAGDGVLPPDEHESAMVQDSIQAGVGLSGSCVGPDGTPAKLRTLLVRRPGRVSAAIQFVERCLTVVGFGACGDGDAVEKDVANGGTTLSSGKPSAEFLRARAAALNTMAAYFAGHIDDDLLIEADFKIEGQVTTLRCVGPLDGETGRMRDPKYTPAAPKAPVREPAAYKSKTMVIKMPPDIPQSSVVDIRPGPRPGVVLIIYKSWLDGRDTERLIDAETGETVR